MKLQEQINRIQEMMGIPNDNQSLVDDIKKHLIMDRLVDEDEFNELYNGDWDEAWKDVVDNQENGECQSIVADIIRNFPQVTKVFGEIEIDEPYYDEYDEEQTLVTHHWIEIDGEKYDFSKGTLKDYIDWDDIYDVKPNNDEWRYQEL